MCPTLLDRCDVVFDTINVTDGESKAVESATRIKAAHHNGLLSGLVAYCI